MTRSAVLGTPQVQLIIFTRVSKKAAEQPTRLEDCCATSIPCGIRVLAQERGKQSVNQPRRRLFVHQIDEVNRGTLAVPRSTCFLLHCLSAKPNREPDNASADVQGGKPARPKRVGQC